MQKFLKLDYKKTLKLQEDGKLLKVVSILQLVLAEQLQVEVQIY
jgi:hypothetical protein